MKQRWACNCTALALLDCYFLASLVYFSVFTFAAYAECIITQQILSDINAPTLLSRFRVRTGYLRTSIYISITGKEVSDQTKNRQQSAHKENLNSKMKSIATKAEFDLLIAREKYLVVVDFYATWCGPCKIIAPQLEKWAEEFDDVVFIKIDVDENDETAEECEVQAMPTFHFYKGGKRIDVIVGANQDKIREKILALK
uniref:Thioredoxin domain-containing protein n=1 Tax=Arion vulgaris TaxID=1028688 RepID=A0A0B7AVK4_9EUPU